MSPASEKGLIKELETRVADGDADALAQFFELHRDRLSRLVALRMDVRLQGKIDAADVLQESFVEASSRLKSYIADDARMPLFLWLRALTHQKLLQIHRHHGRLKRDARLEVSLDAPLASEATSGVIAARLIATVTSPSGVAMREELQRRLEDALEEMGSIDREILALRHFEHLSAAETARVLEIEESAASKRYVRALKRLGEVLRGRSPGSEGGLA